MGDFRVIVADSPDIPDLGLFGDGVAVFIFVFLCFFVGVRLDGV